MEALFSPAMKAGMPAASSRDLSISAFTTSKYFRSVVIVAGGDEY
jgi:hypothetical protein